MKTVGHLNYFLLLLLAFGLAAGPAASPAFAEEAAESEQEAPAAPSAPDTPAALPKPDAPEAPPAVNAIDEASDDAPAENGEPAVVEAQTVEEEKPDTSKDQKEHQHSRRSGNERVSFGSGSTLAEGEYARSVVSIAGSSTSAGEVGDAVVSVMGSSRVTGGTVGGAVVSVLGNTYINGHVRREVVTVLGSVELGPEAVVDGEIVCIGGQLKRAESAVVRGDIHNIGIVGKHFDFTGLSTWLTECLLYGRPLAFNRHLVWAWAIAFGLLGFYALIALIAPSGVVKCVETLEQRPGYSLLTAVLALLLTPVAYILLALTLAIAIGVVLIPIFSLSLFFASIFGKIVMLAWIGRRFTKLMGDGPLSLPVFGVLIGGLIVLGLYTIPVVGFITYKLLGILGLGVVIYTLIRQFKASRPAKLGTVAPAVAPVAAVPSASSVVASPLPAPGLGEVPPPIATPLVSAAPAVISASTLPRAGFWLRLGAALLDLILIGIATGMSEGLFRVFNFHPGGAFPFWIAVYCVIMWATKSTTIGGIICGLKVVRLDDRPVDWGVALVRGLSAFLSLAVGGLGFIWVVFDEEKQSWHDKIAGTTIVKVPKGTSLL
jgi:uncharacterized RDD family membrane protein YckC